jgi:hypothetical protein
MWSFVPAPIEAMIAALNGSTALPEIDVFHALLAGNGRLIAPRTDTLIAAGGLVVALVAVADVEMAASVGLGVTLVADDAVDGDEEDSSGRASCAPAA